MTGFIYCGTYPESNVIKIGMTYDSPSNRRCNIERKSGKTYRMRKYIKINDIPKQDLLFVESWVRRAMANEQGVTYDERSNDHFSYIEHPFEKEKQVENYSNVAIKHAIDCLVFLGYDLAETTVKNCQ